MKNIKWISLTTCVSIFLLTLALLTINQTFSLNNGDNKWDIHFESSSNNVYIDETRIDFYDSLTVGENYTLYVDVVNNGNYNSEISKVLTSDLKEYKLDDSDYTYDDFITYSISYDEDNDTNSIKSLNKVSTYDLLKANTKNKIRIDVRYDINKLDNEKLEYLKNHDNKLNISLYLQLNYKQM
jgi:hypothetical protein